MRHRIALRDLALLMAIVTASAFLAMMYDLSGNISTEQRIELAEIIGLGVVAFVGFAAFAWRRFAEQEREIMARTMAEDRAHHLALHDHLTGLPNRRRLQQEMEAAIAAAPAPGRQHGVFLLDLNGFKKVNDVFGHGAGDEVLCVVADRMREAMGSDAMLARTGGDEFALLACEIDGADGAALIAQRILATLEEPVETASGRHRIGTGIGISLVPKDGTDLSELLRKADTALYRSKHKDGDSFVFFDEEMDRAARRRDLLHRELVKAVARNELAPHYQPIVDLTSERIRAFEALARWTHAELGSIAPEEFIPIAEETGLIRELTDKLMMRACADGLSWPDDVVLCINVSPKLLRDETFGLRVLATLGETGFSPQRLELEITENAIVEDLEAAQRTFGALRDAGIRIALDDFGTGATSLFHLRSFKFDVLKIDRRFIGLMATERESAQIVNAVLGLARGLDVEIVAEGIENQGQLTLLRDKGCIEGQGYLFSPAVPAQEAMRLLHVPKRQAV